MPVVWTDIKHSKHLSTLFLLVSFTVYILTFYFFSSFLHTFCFFVHIRARILKVESGRYQEREKLKPNFKQTPLATGWMMSFHDFLQQCMFDYNFIKLLRANWVSKQIIVYACNGTIVNLDLSTHRDFRYNVIRKNDDIFNR